MFARHTGEIRADQPQRVMQIPSPPANESQRLEALLATKLLDSGPETAFDAVTRCAALITEAPIALISLVDDHRQWFKSRIGLEICETPRDYAFCAHALHRNEPLIVPDTHEDARFCGNPYVVDAPFFRAYAGVPLADAQGHIFGTLCALDLVPRAWSAKHIAELAALAQVVITLIEQSAASRNNQELAGQVEALTLEALANQAFLEEVSEIAQVGGWSFDLGTQTTFWSTQALRLHDLDESFQPTLENAYDHFNDGDRGRVMAALQACAREGKGADLETQIVTALGIRKWVRMTAKAITRKDRIERVIGSIQDISDRIRTQEELRGLASAAQAANRAKDEFLANMSHEIRTPLNGVIGLAGALARTDLAASQREMVHLIQSSGVTLDRLLSDLLDIARIESGKFQLRPAPFDLRETIDSAVQLMRARAAEKNLELTLAYGQCALGSFLGDGVRIRQILSNLTSNAIKFTERGWVRIQIELEDGDSPGAAPQLVIAVSDSGMGFDESFAQRLFGRFEQADASVTRSFGGSGLGLAICLALAKAMGGEISATSQPGIGSVFRARLPLEYTEARLAPAQAPHADQWTLAAPSTSAPRLRILLVEDHPINQQVACLILKPHDVSITIANHGQEALNILETEQFDIVLMDMQMPIMDGLSATRAIREREAKQGLARLPIAMLSANAMREHVDQSLAAGADGHISKPVTTTSLFAGINQVLAQNGCPLLIGRAA